MAKKQGPLSAFFKAFFSKVWMLIGTVIGGIQVILNLSGYYPLVPWTVGLAIMIFCLLVATYLAYRDLYIRLQVSAEKPSPLKLQKRMILPKDIEVIINLDNQVQDKHYHSDYGGINTEYADGFPLDDIMAHNCTKCGKPRNQKGGFYSD